VNLCCGHATCQRVVAETVADAVAEARRTALRDAAEAARAETLHGTADQWDWANWLERRAGLQAERESREAPSPMLTDDERLAVLQAAERQWNVRAPWGVRDLSSVRSPVEQEVERILLARQEGALAEFAEYLHAKAEHADWDGNQGYVDGMRNAAVDAELFVSSIQGRWRDEDASTGESPDSDDERQGRS
jgi:hypothetical protein